MAQTITTIPCRYWQYPICEHTANHLLLAICGEGHIRERLLCEHHTSQVIVNILSEALLCPDCGHTLTRYQTATPIYDNWNLLGAANDTKPIYYITDHTGTIWIDHKKNFTPYLPHQTQYAKHPELYGNQPGNTIHLR